MNTSHATLMVWWKWSGRWRLAGTSLGRARCTPPADTTHLVTKLGTRAMGQTSSADRSAADRELVEKSEKSSLLTDTDDGKVSQPSSPVGSPEKVDPAAAPARPKPEAQEEASSSAAATVRTAAAVVSWMGLNITIGNLNGWILKRHAFSYPVRTPYSPARACPRGLLSPPSRHHCATPSPCTPRTPRTCAGRALLTVSVSVTVTVHAQLAPQCPVPTAHSPNVSPCMRRSCSRPYT